MNDLVKAVKEAVAQAEWNETVLEDLRRDLDRLREELLELEQEIKALQKDTGLYIEARR